MKISEVEDLRIRSKCDWYEKREKYRKASLTLEKRHDIQNFIKTLAVNDEAEINKNIFFCFKTFFPKIGTFLDKRYCNTYKIKNFQN